MRVLSRGTLRDFWRKHPDAEGPLKAWFAEVTKAAWKTMIDIKRRYATASMVDNERVIFNVGGNKYRLIAVIDYQGHKVFVRFVLTHEEYDRGTWKQDTFGDDWRKRQAAPAPPPSRRPRKRR